MTKSIGILLIQTMTKMGFLRKFSCMVKLTFVNTKAMININEQPSSPLSIQRGIRQGYPLAPYLFFIIANALKTKIRQAQQHGETKGVKLLGTQAQ